MSSEEKPFILKTISTPSKEKKPIGEGTFGVVELANLSTQLLKKDASGEYQVVREKTPRGLFVTKTFTRETAEKDAERSVRRYEELKAAGVKHLPGTHRLSDSDPKVVISTYLGGENKLLITSNTSVKEIDRPKSLNLNSLKSVLSNLEVELRAMSAHGLVLEDADAIFFEVSNPGTERAEINYYFGDFDSFVISADDEESAFSESIKYATRSLFRLMMSQKIISNSSKRLQNWSEVASIIQLWTAGFNVDSREIYKKFVEENSTRR